MRTASLAILAALLLMSAVAPSSPAQSPFGGGGIPQAPPEPEATPEPDEQGLDSWQLILIFGGSAALLAGITAAIMRDARNRNARNDDGHEEQRARSRAEREAEHRRRKQTSRRKGRAAKRARRANRPR
jgi:hypothetical protein